MTAVRGLALGTAQFGLPYGISGRGVVVSEVEVRAVLERAAASGVEVLDTAPAYGDVEARLAQLADGLPFSVVSKIAAVPQNAADAAGLVRASVERSLMRLGGCLKTLLFHSADDLLRPDGDLLWRTAAEAAGSQALLGVSVYDPQMIVDLRSRYPLAVAQVPGNALDQRLSAGELSTRLTGMEVQLRSIFLQGLLLLSHRQAAKLVPAASAAHARWVEWCRAEDLPPLVGALSLARALPGVSLCVIGVESETQLREVLDGWEKTSGVFLQSTPQKDTRRLFPPSLASQDPAVIDPRLWPANVARTCS